MSCSVLFLAQYNEDNFYNRGQAFIYNDKVKVCWQKIEMFY